MCRKATDKAKECEKRDSYEPRIKYSGYLKNTKYIPKKSKEDHYITDVSHSEMLSDAKRRNRKNVYWKNFALLMGFCGTNYYGMQFNKGVATIEENLFRAMLKHKWITQENFEKPWTIKFQRGSRTDRGVSAMRMVCSLWLPKDVDIDALNADLPSDIRVFGVQRVTKQFDSRMNCDARTYSYTLPTVAFAHYNDQTPMKDYRLSADRLKWVNDNLLEFKGNKNFHNFTVDKEYFDRSSIRRIDKIECGQPFLVDDVEFARVEVKGQSFMLHQIRKMMGFQLAVIREIIPIEILKNAMQKEKFNAPTAPGLGLLLERLHFTRYDRAFGDINGKLDWSECEDDVEEFRRKFIHPKIVQTEIEENSMVEWLEYLVNHSYDPVDEEESNVFDDSWGEDPEFWKKVENTVEQRSK